MEIRIKERHGKAYRNHLFVLFVNVTAYRKQLSYNQIWTSKTRFQSYFTTSQQFYELDNFFFKVEKNVAVIIM